MLTEIKLVSHITPYKPLLRGKWFKKNSEIQSEFPLLKCYSNLKKLKRVMAYVLRAINIMKRNKITGPLTTRELSWATSKLVQMDQTNTFQKELKAQRDENETKNGTI